MSAIGRKPDTRTAMRDLLARIRAALPFDAAEARVCDGPCDGCSLKLLEFMETELGTWESRLDAGETPHFGDLARLERTARKVLAVLAKNGRVQQG